MKNILWKSFLAAAFVWMFTAFLATTGCHQILLLNLQPVQPQYLSHQNYLIECQFQIIHHTRV